MSKNHNFFSMKMRGPIQRNTVSLNRTGHLWPVLFSETVFLWIGPPFRRIGPFRKPNAPILTKHHVLLQDWRNLHMVWMMHLDAGGTFLTRHCVAMTWFPHEPNDAVTYWGYSRVSELGKTGDKRAVAQQNDTKDAFTLYKKNAGSHSWKSSYRKIRGKNHQFLCGWSLWNRWKRNGTTRFDQTWKRFSSWFRRLERCYLCRTEHSLDTRFPKRAVRWSQSMQGHGSLTDYESQKISGHFRWSCNIHTRTDTKNLVTTARTIYLNKKETIHMISMLRKEACSGSIHDLAHSPTPRFAWQTASRKLQPKRTIWSQLCRHKDCSMLTFTLIYNPFGAQSLLVNLV